MPPTAIRYLQGLLRANYPVQRARQLCGDAFGWTERDNFILLSAPRSGTTVMVDYLNCSRQLRCYGEILGPGQIQYGHAPRMTRERLNLHVRSYFAQPPGRLTGAKIMTFHLDELPLNLTRLRALAGQPKILVLYRANMLEQYTSFRLAEARGNWHATRPCRVNPLWLDPDDALAFMDRERRMWRENFEQMAGAQVHVLSYERLLARTEESMRQVFDFLGVRPGRVRSRFVRTNPQPLEQKIVNYRAFVDGGVVQQSLLELPHAAATLCAAA